MRAATEGSLPPVMPQGNLVEVLGREVRQGSPGELMVESSPSRQRRPPCKTNKEMSDEAADAAALTYLLCGQTRPPANNTKPRRRAWPLWAPDLAPYSALGQKPPRIQNKASQGHQSNVGPEKATEAQPIVKLAPLSALGQLQRPIVGHGDNGA